MFRTAFVAAALFASTALTSPTVPSPSSSSPSDVAVIRVSNAGNDASDGSSWAKAKATIHAALSALPTGGEVWVAAGYYGESVTMQPGARLYGGFSGSETALDQRDPVANISQLAPENAPLRIVPGAGPDTVIDGMYIAMGGPGYGSCRSGTGGGILCDHSSPTIQHDHIAYNCAGYGGGIAILDGSPTITENDFDNNGANYLGGTIYAADSSPIISDNRFTNTGDLYFLRSTVQFECNTVSAGRTPVWGSDSHLAVLDNRFDGVLPTVVSNSFQPPPSPALVSISGPNGSAEVLRNDFRDDLINGVQCSGGASARIADNVFRDGFGAAVTCDGGQAAITNNTMAQNGARDGVLVLHDCVGTVVSNNIVAFNAAGVASDGSAVLKNNCVVRNDVFNYSGISEPTGSAGNIASDPKFAILETGDLHIQPDSPCRDAGDDVTVQASDTDIDGQPRVFSAHVDIGADESNGTTLDSIIPVVRVTPSGNDASNGSSWSNAKRTVPAAIAALTDGGEVWVAGGVYTAGLTIPSYVYVYGGFAGTETARDQRNWYKNQTVLNGSETVANPNVAVLDSIEGNGYRTGALDGFVLVDAGVGSSPGSPTIAHNTILGGRPGVAGDSGAPLIADNVITGNFNEYAPGISWEEGAPSIVNNTIAYNTSDPANESASGGGALSLIATNAFVANNIIAFNTVGIVTATYTDGPPDASIFSHNCIYGNTTQVTGIPDPTGTNGNISVYPWFADPSQANLHIQPFSECVDAGDDGAVLADDLDIDAQPRIQGAHVDIGADESDLHVWKHSVTPVIRVSPNGNDGNDGTSWASAKRTIGGALGSFGDSAGEVWVAAGIYSESVTLPQFISLYGGFNGTETSRGQRDWNRNLTVISQGPVPYVVTINPGSLTSALDGFTLKLDPLTYKYSGSVVIISTNASPLITNDVVLGDANVTNGSPTLSSSAVQGTMTFTGGSPSVLANKVQGIVRITHGETATVSDNLVTTNPTNIFDTSFARSSAIDVEYMSSAIVTNNTVAGTGGGMEVYAIPTAVVINNIVAFNAYPFATAEIADLVYANNDVYGNAYDYWSPPYNVGVDGNISADPRFVNYAYGDLHLQPDSPCRNAGDNSVVSGVDVDADGEPRIQEATADIGGDESDGLVRSVPPPLVVRVSPAGNDTADGSSWASAKKTVEAAIIQVTNAGGGEVWAAAGTYNEQIEIPPFVYVYGGFNGSETSREQRDSSANITTLAGQPKQTVVYAFGGFRTNAIDGFTIRGGVSAVDCASSIVSNNLITGNTSPFSTSIGAYTGSAVYSAAAPLITNNRIVGNKGNGVVLSQGLGTVSNNVISGNSARWGGGIQSTSFPALIENNLITGNTALYGGGIYFNGNYLGSAINNTVAGNTATVAGGGMIFVPISSAATVNLENNIVAFNVGGLSNNVGKKPFATVMLHNNDVYGNSGYNFQSLADPTGSDGNISVDPKFANPSAMDYHLFQTSACIDTGDDAVVTPGELDLDGLPRIYGPHVDIGAYEFRPGGPNSLGAAALALKVAGGLLPEDAADLTLLDAWPKSGGDGRITTMDALVLARRAIAP